MDPIALAQALVRCPSVTPADAGALGVVADALSRLGFECHRLTFGEAPDGPIDNLFATYGSGGPHFAFAGHTDVVPEGGGWSVDPYAGEIRGGRLVGRGAADMKGALAAMLSAAAAHVARGAPGTLSFIVTGDEEGPATYGTDALLDWMEANGHRPHVCLVGEPSSALRLGDMMKIGRRGSLNAWIRVIGAQGHVAYPDRADNPLRRLVPILNALQARRLDEGTQWFGPSNLEITDLAVGNPATNVIPAEARARLNIRFNDLHRGEELAGWIRETVAAHAPSAEVTIRISGEAFLTQPGVFSTLVADAVEAETGLRPELSTSGGTSDARFIRRMCPVVEFGLPGQSMHKVDEEASVADIEALARIYDRVLAQVFAG
ncbi:succinyl-diaminopimelate desuccinylase [Sandaracinobacter sp. RS1-74]|uniref:succinyl-diaminopimelate desuccinylase n=1 Tax=Sandaracinobacteroides sayramensis TaxID=2913411 RepID=UPI001EDAAD56|nr:succinyl-diaminopimelate desuccinylase [Sandaracinobacteroides sayramensis]MCG2841744.1 succinyl-diaminopimelate desuccinylase [Sandaracinobacteroides sayramensis]